MFDDLKPHLAELRKRLGISVATVIVMFFVMFNFHEPIMSWMTQPLNEALAEVAKVSKNAAQGMVTTTQVGGTFFVAMKVSFFAGLLASLPIVLAQIWLFVAPGLYENEKKMLYPFIFGGTIMFVAGALFAYYVVTPFGFSFLIAFGAFEFVPLINIEDYIDFFAKIMFGFGLAFELPIICYFLALMGLIDDRMMTGFFRYAIVLIMIISAILTPPDVLTQILMAIPLTLLYGISILIVRAVNPAPKEEPYIAEDEEETID
ncbi:MAG: preprotein translocase subunit TatC [Sulfuricurvum sp. MLSB]|uniref:twin-arginine translocase subunit TatC n=1 Tax=unclassified Sulfuricurvum TaxID=2632390 RepID=UPI000502C8D0|nr:MULTISPECIES: twin-arginine translocase subunit TatC [unclassified Sulfuricurvum]KFN38856.1 MAG: preprotein translocase subunit TatC [Sulfuricurvum sp. MLSB]